MEIKKDQLVTLWNGQHGTVLSTVSNKANVRLANGQRMYVDFSEITAATDTYSEKQAKFLQAQDRLAAYKTQAAIKTKSEEQAWEKAREAVQNSSGKPVSNFTDQEWAEVFDILYPIQGVKRTMLSTLKAFAPGKVDEATWGKAKNAVKDSSGKNISDFGDKEWATVNTVYKNMGGKFKSKTAGHTNEYDTQYKIGDMLVDVENPNPESSMIIVKDIKEEQKTYVLERWPVNVQEVDGLEPAETYGVRYEESISKIDGDKKLKRYSAIELGCPNALVGVEKQGANICLSFRDFNATYFTDGKLISTSNSTNFGSYASEFGALIADNGYEALASVVAQRRLADKLKQADAPYKSDEAIADEFTGMMVESVEITHGNIDTSEFLSGNISINFPAAGEHVGGGQEGEATVYEHWIFYNYQEWKTAGGDEGGVIPRIAFDNWYPERTGMELREAIISEIEKQPKTAGKTITARLRPENQKMQEFLKSNGIDAKAKYIPNGSLRGTWRLYNPVMKWTPELQNKLANLGFTDFDGRALNPYSGNGGVFSVFVRGHDELLQNAEPQPEQGEEQVESFETALKRLAAKIITAEETTPTPVAPVADVPASKRMAVVNDVLENGIYDAKGRTKKLEGAILDAFTASAMKQVYDALSPAGKSKFDTIPLNKLISFVWKAVGASKQAATVVASELAQGMAVEGAEDFAIDLDAAAYAGDVVEVTFKSHTGASTTLSGVPEKAVANGVELPGVYDLYASNEAKANGDAPVASTIPLTDISAVKLLTDVDGDTGKKVSSLAKKAARLGVYDFDIHGGKNWELEATAEGAKLKRREQE